VDSEWPSTRWQLSAPESFVLLNGPGASGREAFKLGVMELVARGVLVLDEPGTTATLRDGPRARAPSERALAAIWDVYVATPKQSWAGRSGARLKDLGRSTIKQYGSLKGFVKQEVLPALVERGLFERREGRILWIFPTTSFELTPQGVEARTELERWLEVGRQRFRDWSSDDPRQALTYAGLLGAGMLLMPALYGDLADLRERARVGATADGGASTPVVTDDDQTGDFDFGDFDLGGFDFSGIDFGGFDASFSDSGGGFGDGGGSSGDGGSGGGGDGGGGGGGGE
jgi:hypothetical protein